MGKLRIYYQSKQMPTLGIQDEYSKNVSIFFFLNETWNLKREKTKTGPYADFSYMV